MNQKIGLIIAGSVASGLAVGFVGYKFYVKKKLEGSKPATRATIIRKSVKRGSDRVSALQRIEGDDDFFVEDKPLEVETTAEAVPVKCWLCSKDFVKDRICPNTNYMLFCSARPPFVEKLKTATDKPNDATD